MHNRHRILVVITAALAALTVLLFLLGGLSRPVQATSAATTRCVTPTGTGCSFGVCGNLCYGSVQAAVDAADPGDDIFVSTGTYTGVHARSGITQMVYLTETVTIRGGYSSDLTAWDPDLYPTTLDAQRQGRVVFLTGDISPTLEHLILKGGNSTGQIINCLAESYPDGCGGGIYVILAQPTIANNVITDNVAAVTSIGLPTGYVGYGGGVYMVFAHGAVISGNLIYGNTGSLAAGGSGGGIHLRQSNALVHSNQILNNYATTANHSAATGGGVSIYSCEPTIYNNLIQGNWVNGIGGGHGAGLYQWYDFGPSRVANNRITGNHGNQAVYLGYSEAHFTANQVVSNATSIGVYLSDSNSPMGPTLINNVVARSGERSLSASGQVSWPVTVTLVHNTIAGSGTGYGVHVDGGHVTLMLTNTIVASHTWGITNAFPTSSTVTADHTLFHEIAQNWTNGGAPVFGDPAFVDPAGGDYHILPHSAALDATEVLAVENDMDGDHRPVGSQPDIGADEAELRFFLPLVVRNH
jgi:hypothetical protein